LSSGPPKAHRSFGGPALFGVRSSGGIHLAERSIATISSENAWVRIASSVRTSAVDRLKNKWAHRHACTLEAMRIYSQWALFIVSARRAAS
jgi:hypothetical protein